jgi:hypothetical protein
VFSLKIFILISVSPKAPEKIERLTPDPTALTQILPSS